MPGERLLSNGRAIFPRVHLWLEWSRSEKAERSRPEARSAEVQRGARMPGQRRAGKLVYLYIYIYIYIYKTVVCDRVLTLYRPCAYPGAVLRHASGPTGPRNSSRSFSPFIKSSLPGSSKSRCSRKQTKPSLSKSTTLLWKWSFSYQKVFLAHFHGFVVWSVHVSKSCHSRIDRTLSVRRIVMSCFLPDESPKFGNVLRSSNRRSRDRRNHVVPESKPNPASPQLYFENEASF